MDSASTFNDDDKALYTLQSDITQLHSTQRGVQLFCSMYKGRDVSWLHFAIQV